MSIGRLLRLIIRTGRVAEPVTDGVDHGLQIRDGDGDMVQATDHASLLLALLTGLWGRKAILSSSREITAAFTRP